MTHFFKIFILFFVLFGLQNVGMALPAQIELKSISFDNPQPLGGVSADNMTYDYGGTWVELSFSSSVGGCLESIVKFDSSNALVASVSVPDNVCTSMEHGVARFFVSVRGVLVATPIMITATASGRSVSGVLTVTPTNFAQIDFLTGKASTTTLSLTAYSSQAHAQISVYVGDKLLGLMKQTGDFNLSGDFSVSNVALPYQIFLRSQSGACSTIFMSKNTGGFGSAFDRCQ